MDYSGITIETERLLLVPVTQEYTKRIFAELTSAITRYMYPRAPVHIHETRRFVKRSVRRIKQGTDLPVIVLRKANGEFLGGAGIHRVTTRMPELGIWIKKSAHGNGFGKEAVLGLKTWADRNITYECLIYPVERENAASRRIPEAMAGVVHREYTALNQSGREQDLLEYRIYPA